MSVCIHSTSRKRVKLHGRLQQYSRRVEIYKIFSRTQHQSTQATYKGNSQALWVVYNNGISTVKAQEQ